MTETTSSSEARRDGRLEDPDVELRTDPRLHPGLLADLAALGLDGRAAPPPFDRSAGLEAIAEFLGERMRDSPRSTRRYRQRGQMSSQRQWTTGPRP